MMRIITNPTKSVGSNTASVHATAEIVAITGSLVPSMVARIEPTRTTPAMYSQNAPNVPPITVNAISPTPSQSNCGAVAHGRTNGSSTSPEIRNAMPLTVKMSFSQPLPRWGGVDDQERQEEHSLVAALQVGQQFGGVLGKG